MDKYIGKDSEVSILKWVGIGSSWSKEFDNTSAMFLDNQHLVLIDCGSLIFNKLLRKNVLDKITSATILITHLHGDHVGSLVDTIMYLYYKRGIKVDLVFNDNKITELLQIQGLSRNTYNFISNFITDKSEIRAIPLGIKGLSLHDVRKVDHVDTLDCYSYDFKYNDKIYIISGDIKYFPKVLRDYNNEGILGEAYLDVSIDDYPGIPHLTLDELLKECPREIRSKVFCVHQKTSEECRLLESLGFSVPTEL